MHYTYIHTYIHTCIHIPRDNNVDIAYIHWMVLLTSPIGSVSDLMRYVLRPLETVERAAWCFQMAFDSNEATGNGLLECFGWQGHRCLCEAKGKLS